MSLYPGNSGTLLHGNFGYPYRGSGRRLRPSVLAVVHITGNSRLPSALAEAQYSARDGSGASFTFVVNRNGTIVQCLHPETQTPWTNGDLNNPNRTIPTVNDMVIRASQGYSANELCFLTVESVGYNPGYPITAAQIDRLADLIAWGSKVSGLPINRTTVLGHRDINSVSRYNCPTPLALDAFLGVIIAKANAILNAILNPTPAPEPSKEINMRMREKYEEWSVPSGTPFWTDGPGIGAVLHFPADALIETTAEEWDPDAQTTGVWRTFRRRYNGEIAWIDRRAISPRSLPDAATYNANVKAALERRDEATALRERIAKKDVVFERIRTETPKLAESGKAI